LIHGEAEMSVVIDPAKVRLAKTVIQDRAGFWCAAIDGVRNKLYLGATDFTVHVHDLPSLEKCPQGSLKGHDSYVTAMVYLPESQALVTGSFDRHLLWWHPGKAATPVKKVEAGARINRLAASPDGTRLAAATDDLVSRIWDARSGQIQIRLKGGHPATTAIGRRNTLYSIAFSPDGKRLATGDRAGTICFWETATGKLLHRAAAGVFYSQAFFRKTQNSEYEWGGVRSLAFSPDGRLLAAGGMGPADQNSAGTDGAAHLEAFDAATGKSLAASPLSGSKGMLMSMVFHPQGNWLIAGGGGGQNGVGFGEICLWDYGRRDKAGKRIPPVHHKTPTVVREVIITPDGCSVVAVGMQREMNAGRIELWNLSGGPKEKLPTFFFLG
jgi:WD40 repeat protein